VSPETETANNISFIKPYTEGKEERELK